MHFFKLILHHIKPALDSAKLRTETAAVTTKFRKQFALHVVECSSVSKKHFGATNYDMKYQLKFL